MTTHGEALLYANAPNRDRARALDLLTRAANLGDAKAMGLVGFIYEFGLGVGVSFERCESYYQAAAARGHAVSMTRLAFLKNHGRPGINVDSNEAKAWVARTCGLFQLGAPTWACNAPSTWDSVPRMTEDGDPDPLAWLWWAAVVCECSSAQYAIGSCYSDGVGLKRDPPTVFAWYRKSADQGNLCGVGILGYCYGEAFGVDLDTQLAFQYYLQAAMQGETVAVYNVGWCYEKGTVPGVKGPDYSRAVLWYWSAAKARRVPYQPDEAFKWFLLAAQQDQPDAMSRIGNAYQYGLSVSENVHEAVRWYSRAAKF
ncbi:hypothetical protein GGF32_009762 [Allomyces javanicus]|nr:hypothetical protein GGF32_009762 [Allomyces javanicus]